MLNVRFRAINWFFIFVFAQFETLIARAEEWFLELEAESQKLIGEVIMINGELCTQIETLLKGEMEASTKEMDETHTEEVTALLEQMDVCLDEMKNNLA